MADASRSILDHEDQLDLLSRSVLTAPADPVVAVTRVGQELRNARERKGTQLSEVSRAVNVHPNYLAAIEDGRYEELPGPAFTIGYVARYARHLGLDVENVVDRFGAEIAPRYGAFDDHIDITPLPDRNLRPAFIAIALLLLVGLIYSADDIVAFTTGAYEQIAEKAVDAPTQADEQTPIGAVTPPVPPPTGIAVTPPVSLRADLTPASIERARIAAIPLPSGIAVTPPASLRADLTPASIEQARIAAIPLPSGIAVTPPASLRADLTPAAIEQARIAAIPLPGGIAVTPPASLRADLTPEAIRQETRVAALLPMPLPAGIAVTPPASLSADLMPASIQEQIRIARIPLPAGISVTPPASLRADLTPASIERAHFAAIPLPARIAVTPPASLRADLTPASIEEARIAAIPLLTEIAVTPPAVLRADLTPASIEEARIAAIPLPAGIAVTPPASLRADLTPAAIREQTRVASLFPMPLPAEISVTLPATLRADLEPAAIERAIAVAAILGSSPLPTRISVTPSVSLRADLTQSVEAQLPPGRRYGLRNRDSRITLRVHRPTFVAVRGARGQIFLERRLARGDTYSVPNRVGLTLTARDAGAVEIILDGASLGFVGSRGIQARALSLNPQSIVDRAGQAQVAIAQALPAAAPPPPTPTSVTPQVSSRADLAQSDEAQLPPGRQYGLGNRDSRITLRVHRPTFVAVRGARGQIFLERRLTPGDTYSVPNRAGLRLTARDAGAVEVILDGASLGFAGSRGLQASGLSLNPQAIADRLSRF